MTEREQMKAELFALEEEAKSLRKRCVDICGLIRGWLNHLMFDPAEMRVAEADERMDELVVRQAELLRTETRIEALKKALYD